MSELHNIPGDPRPFYKVLTEKALKEIVQRKQGIDLTHKDNPEGYCPRREEIEEYLANPKLYRLVFRKRPEYLPKELVWELDFDLGLETREVKYILDKTNPPIASYKGDIVCSHLTWTKHVLYNNVEDPDESKVWEYDLCHTFDRNPNWTERQETDCYTFTDSEENVSEEVCVTFTLEGAERYMLIWNFNGGNTTDLTYTTDRSYLMEGDPISYPEFTSMYKEVDGYRYKFKGWDFNEPKMPARTLTITALWDNEGEPINPPEPTPLPPGPGPTPGPEPEPEPEPEPTLVTITFKIVNGTWTGGSNSNPITNSVKAGDTVTVPTGQANEGYEGGTWSPSISGTTITASTSITYTLSFSKKLDPLPGPEEPEDVNIIFYANGGSWT